MPGCRLGDSAITVISIGEEIAKAVLGKVRHMRLPERLLVRECAEIEKRRQSTRANRIVSSECIVK